MKRSEINKIMQDGLDFIEKDMNFLLPPFARWSPRDWMSRGKESVDILEQQLGWDITDFGSGEFEKTGLIKTFGRDNIFKETDRAGESMLEAIHVAEKWLAEQSSALEMTDGTETSADTTSPEVDA